MREQICRTILLSLLPCRRKKKLVRTGLPSTPIASKGVGGESKEYASSASLPSQTRSFVPGGLGEKKKKRKEKEMA